MKIVIVDIDGTVSKVGERLKYLKQDPPDWDKFYDDCFEDEPIYPIIDIVRSICCDYHIVFCTGRRESVRSKTVSWLLKHALLDGPVKALLMRDSNDHRHDTEVKPELIKKAGIILSDIAFVIEDRSSMVKKWRELGLVCLQPFEGDF